MEPLLISLERIWDFSPHCALTDLLLWNGNFYCVLREADSHFGGVNGIIRVLISSNGMIWKLVATLEEEGWDLRDPKLSIAPDGKLMLLMGALRLNRKQERVALQSLVSFSQDGISWSSSQVALEREWLWRITWFQGVGYGVSYFLTHPAEPRSPTLASFYQTNDGLHYQRVTSFQIDGSPSEGTIRFFPDGRLMLLLRRDGADKHAWIGISVAPYEDWLFTDSHMQYEGANFLILPNGSAWAAGRITITQPYGGLDKTALCSISKQHLKPQLILPSGGDCSYPGMVYEAPYLYLSYYSSHEGTTAVYFAKIELPI